MALSPPGPDEFAPFYAGYVARVSAVVSPLEELRAQRARLVADLSALSDEQARFRYAPGKWSVKEMIGHLADAERIFAYRLLRVARGDATPLPGWEENGYVRTAASDERALADLVDDWASARDSTVALVAGIPADAWLRRGTVNDGAMSARALAYITLGHVEHHRAVLRERYGVPRA
jgi:uncharacterized damage-inducible protein DinB